jgi:hypothetical protein
MSDDLVKGFILSNEAWYCQIPQTRLPEDEILIANFGDNGKTVEVAEAMITWENGIPNLVKYEDTKADLKQIPEAIPLIKDTIDREITIKEFSESLLDIGYVDFTQRQKQL